MNTIHHTSVLRRAALTVATAATLVAMPAWAESPAIHTEIDRAVSNKSYADVRAELQRARADGSIHAWSASYNPLKLADSLKSRADLYAEVLASRQQPALVAEDSGSFAMLVPAPQRHRGHVALR